MKLLTTSPPAPRRSGRAGPALDGSARRRWPGRSRTVRLDEGIRPGVEGITSQETGKGNRSRRGRGTCRSGSWLWPGVFWSCSLGCSSGSGVQKDLGPRRIRRERQGARRLVRSDPLRAYPWCKSRRARQMPRQGRLDPRRERSEPIGEPDSGKVVSPPGATTRDPGAPVVSSPREAADVPARKTVIPPRESRAHRRAWSWCGSSRASS